MNVFERLFRSFSREKEPDGGIELRKELLHSAVVRWLKRLREDEEKVDQKAPLVVMMNSCDREVLAALLIVFAGSSARGDIKNILDDMVKERAGRKP